MATPEFSPPTRPSSSELVVLDDQHRVVTTTGTVSADGRAGRLAVAGLIGALALGGAFGARTALTGPTGPASPEEAVSEFFEALDAEDLVGLAAAVHPGERESIGEPLFEMLDHGKRLEIVSDDVDPAAAGFLDITVEGLTYSVENTGPGLRYVTTTGGTISAPTQPGLPGGPLWDAFDIDMPASDPTRLETDLAVDPMQVAVVEHDGSWYVSLWYSAAERARRDAGLAFPGLGTGPAPVGAAAPDQVLEDLLRAVLDLDAEGVLTLMDPQEAVVLYDYAPLFLDAVQQGLDDLTDEVELDDVVWNVETIDFDAVEVNGRQVVSFVSMAVSFEVTPDEPGAEPVRGSIRVDDGCLITTVDGETANSCDVEAGLEAEVNRIGQDVVEVLDFSATTVSAFERLRSVDTGITVVEREGRWYVSLMPTLLQTGNDLLGVLEPADLVAFGTDVEEIIAAQDDIVEEMAGVLRRVDWQALDQSGGASTISEMMNGFTTGGLGIEGTTAGSIEFDPVEAGPLGDDSGFGNDAGPLDSVLAPSVAESFEVGPDETFLSWYGDLGAAPGYVAGVYAFDTDWEGSIEVILFEAPADPGAVLGDDWTFTRDGEITVAADEWGTTFAFVGDYVLWGDLSSDTSAALFDEQLAMLAAS